MKRPKLDSFLEGWAVGFVLYGAAATVFGFFRLAYSFILMALFMELWRQGHYDK